MKLADPNLASEKYVQGLENPTTMAFLGPNDILVLEKNKGTVKRIVNGAILDEPALDLNVANRHERGLLGIAIGSDDNSTKDGDRYNGKNSNRTYVYLYFTKGETGDGEDNGPFAGHKIFGNSLYRYEFLNNGNRGRLVNPELLFELPPSNYTFHNGGALLVGPGNNIYAGTGDLTQPYKTVIQNNKNGSFPSGTGGILAFTREGKAINGKEDGGILGDKNPLDKYYAYGIRNTFGMDFDPISGKLWDTENGPFYGDEINIVEPGFNSGWSKVQGIWRPTKNLTAGELELNPNDLVTFNHGGRYSSPEFTWKQPVGPTALVFLNSTKLGERYENDMFVGDINNGYLYHFDLIKNRTVLDLDYKAGGLTDKVANTTSELTDVIFGRGFGGVTDIKVGPADGYLYVVSHRQGTIYRIVPIDGNNKMQTSE